MKYDYGVFIGRFQPFHEGHARVIETALQNCNKLIVLIGSANGVRTLRNPWTWREREAMIQARFPMLEDRIICEPLEDMTYRDQEWLTTVQEIVSCIIDGEGWTDKPATVALVGSQKDSTGYYLNLFPRWESIGVEHKNPLNATDIRNILFGNAVGDPTKWLADDVQRTIKPHLSEKWFFELRDEAAWVEKFKQPYSALPYPPIFQTVDAVVVASGHVLLIERGHRPGKGLLALPGGYLNEKETFEEATLRELREETKIDVSDTRLRAAKVRQRVFDDPHRSVRGRVITTATLFSLPNERTLPKVKGSDDAAAARWVPFKDVQPDVMFEDHYHIIKSLVAGI